ncbi:LysR family substrate-binding domain-containing protein [Arthrobacter sp. MI7-26]|nr:LysR family substrate-binding domain-containing protein [Arthrobacter sp. MI7-26]MCX2749817.1 LysR family substrate-binding domain-containing protein [Arthrobacter sp. MI7-26]
MGRGDALHLHIGYSHSFGIESLPLILNELHLAAPEVTVTAVVALADHALSGLLHGQFDLVVVRSPILPPTVETVVLRNEPLGVIVGDKHPAAQSEVIHADQLAESTILMWPRGHSPGYADKVLAAFGRGPTDDLVYIFETFTPDGFLGDKRALSMLASGQAFQTAMKTHYDPVPAGFVWRPLEPRLEISVELLRRQGATTRAQRLFIEVAKDVSQMNNWLDEEDRTS